MLLRRGKTFYCRIWIPIELRDIIGRKELKKSLRTTDRKDAKAAASFLVHQAETGFLRLRMGMGMLTDRELEQITAKLVADFTGRIQEHRKRGGDHFDFLHQGIPHAMGQTDLDLIDTTFVSPKTLGEAKSVAAVYDFRIKALEEERATGMFSQQTRTVAERFGSGKVEMPPVEWFNVNDAAWDSAPPVGFAQICDAVITGMIEGYQAEAERVLGRRAPYIEAAVAARMQQAKPQKCLSDLWTSYKNDRMAVNSWALATVEKYEGFCRLFLDIVGDCQLVAFEDDGAAAQFIENIQKYPKGKNQITSPYRGKSFSPAWADKPGFKALEPAQINDMLIQIGAWFNYALDNPKHWNVTRNPFKNKRLPVPEKREKPRTAYTMEEILKLIAGLMKQRPLVQPQQFWIPLLGLFTGARINELCQLRVEDVQLVDNIWGIHFRHLPEKMQFTKAKKSRFCPVHPALIDLGFVDFANKQRSSGHDRLFPKLMLFKHKWSHQFGKWYNETFEPKYISTEPDKVFHSTRHSLISWFKANMQMTLHNLSVLKSMIGHLDDIDKALIGIDLDNDMTWGSKNYGDEHSPKVQVALLKKLDYGADISVLKARLK